MRIIAGRLKGLRLANVGKGDAGAHLRPTTDRVRESLFNVLNGYIDFDGLRVLDLFAGTGALGFEAVSRGASFCTFVDSGRVAQKLISENVQITNTKDCTRVYSGDALRLPKGDPHDLIFLDPPYSKGFGPKCLTHVQAQGWIAEDALVVCEDTETVAVPGFETLGTRRYGGTTISILQAP